MSVRFVYALWARPLIAAADPGIRYAAQSLSVAVSVPLKRAPAPNVWKLAAPLSPANWPVPLANAMVSSSKNGLPYEMAPAWSCPVPDGRGQKRPVSGPEVEVV